jgi:mRNA interferase RelE/StbE
MELRTYQRNSLKIKQDIYPVLRNNPFFGPNIKRLKGELSSIYRYRIGNYRLFYSVDTEKRLVFILDLEQRKDAYR